MRKFPAVVLAFLLLLCIVQLPQGAEGAGETAFLGQVTDVGGGGFPGVQIKAMNVTTLVTYSTTSDGDGNYTLDVVRGLYNVTASYLNYSANVSYVRVQVDIGQEVRLDFTMAEVLCTLTGYVTNGTQPIYGATVTLINGERIYSGASVNPLGQYTIGDVAPGTYTVTARKVGYYDSDPLPPIVMVRGATKNLDFELQEQPAELYGRVSYQGDGVSGVKVTLTSSQFNAVTYTDDRGNYSFELVPSGNYVMTLRKDNFLDRTVNVGISPFEVKRLDVELEYDVANTTQEFLFGFDLAHSLMVVGLVVSLIVLAVALYVNFKLRRKPEMLEREKGSEEE